MDVHHDDGHLERACRAEGVEHGDPGSRNEVGAGSGPHPSQSAVRRHLFMAVATLTYLVIAVTAPGRLDAGPATYALAACLAVLLLRASMIDVREHRLPDPITLAILALALVRAGLSGREAVSAAALAAALGFGMLWLVATAYFRLRQREGLGRGDVKLFAAVAAWVGVEGLASVLLIAALAALAGAAMARQFCAEFDARAELPFGPAIALAAWIVLWWGPVGLAAVH